MPDQRPLTEEQKKFQDMLQDKINEVIQTQDDQTALDVLSILAKITGGLAGTFIFAGANQAYLHDLISQNMTLGIKEAMEDLHNTSLLAQMDEPANHN